MRCVLCARRGKVTEGATHVCVNCAAWLQVQVADIARLAADAAAYLMPGSTSGSGSRSVPGSRPPLRVEALDAELTVVPGTDATVLELCELWERMIREMRQMTPYGPASAARAAEMARKGDLRHRGGTDGAGVAAGTKVTLIGVTGFLGRQVPWMTAEPDFPVDDFADEVRACVRALSRWDLAAEERGTMVRCPTLLDEGECGYRLYYTDVHEDVTCRRCGTMRSAMTLAAVAMADGREVWLDPEAAASWLGVTEGTLRQWARKGRVQRSHGRYLVRERIGA